MKVLLCDHVRNVFCSGSYFVQFDVLLLMRCPRGKGESCTQSHHSGNEAASFARSFLREEEWGSWGTRLAWTWKPTLMTNKSSEQSEWKPITLQCDNKGTDVVMEKNKTLKFTSSLYPTGKHFCAVLLAYCLFFKYSTVLKFCSHPQNVVPKAAKVTYTTKLAMPIKRNLTELSEIRRKTWEIGRSCSNSDANVGNQADVKATRAIFSLLIEVAETN